MEELCIDIFVDTNVASSVLKRVLFEENCDLFILHIFFNDFLWVLRILVNIQMVFSFSIYVC